ncbi:MAG: YebC/PmpR family DNA-binding transcriptional regulator [Bacteroidota bacterium]
MGRAFEYRRAAKEKRWANMSRIFPKLAKAITVAAKEGGPDPEMNAKLRAAIQNAKAQNLPKKNIEAAISRASGKDAVDYTEITYEGKGPHGTLVIVECATDNPTRTVANVKSYFNKAGGSVVPNGQLNFLFNRKAVFEFEMPEDTSMDDLELSLIDGGLEEIENDENTVYAYADYTDFGNLSAALEEMGITPTKSGLEYLPTTSIELDEDQLKEVEKMIDKLEDDDDVQNVFTNFN